MSPPTLILAPMLGLTDAAFREAHAAKIGGFDGAISPFVRPAKGQPYQAAVLDELRTGRRAELLAVPQILTNQADEMIELAKMMFDHGHFTVNLNMGCPVTSARGRGRGAGLLPEVEYVDRFLEQVLSAMPCKLSIKTRIGYESETDLLRMAAVFNRYPLAEVVIHPRTAAQKYAGEVNHHRFAEACEVIRHEICFSGDIFAPEDLQVLQQRYPRVKKWMLGRGILRDPLLAAKIKGNARPREQAIVDFYMQVADLYSRGRMGPKQALMRVKGLLSYLGVGRGFDAKSMRKVRKARDLAEALEPLRRRSLVPVGCQ